MDFNENQIESTLRRAPKPAPPAGLAMKITEAMRKEQRRAGGALGKSGTGLTLGRASAGGWRRWWPMALPAAVTAAFAVTWAVRQSEVGRLEEQVRSLREQVVEAPAVASTPAVAPAPGTMESGSSVDSAELERLRGLASGLTAEVAVVDDLRGQLAQATQQLASRRQQVSPEMRMAEDQRNRAQSIVCINNMKQLGLAVRLFATDNNDDFPRDIMGTTNYLGTPKVLVCPEDSGREAAENWGSFTVANLSYEFLASGPGTHEIEPTRVMFRCPIHGHVTLCDGSVQQSVATKHPEALVWRNGKLFFENEVPVTGPNAPPPQHGMSDEMRARYGLPPRIKGKTTTVDASGNVVEVDDPGQFVVTGGPNPQASGRTNGEPPRYLMSPELMKRYGLVPNPPLEQSTEAPAPSPEAPPPN
ncbi:MAG: hypothetical protein IT581_12800 [Verrucomicrobiales bacterium]|nr:hypothetical protein [Verrucomicrobiales bacterium]